MYRIADSNGWVTVHQVDVTWDDNPHHYPEAGGAGRVEVSCSMYTDYVG